MTEKGIRNETKCFYFPHVCKEFEVDTPKKNAYNRNTVLQIQTDYPT